MKLKELKKKLDTLSKEQLNKDFIVIANGRTLSGLGVGRISNETLYNTGDDDPCVLVNKTSLIEDGLELDEIDEFDIVINRGDFYIELP